MKKGTRLDGIRSIDDIKAKCVIDRDSDCWRMRKANGTFAGPHHVVHHAETGKTHNASRLSWMLAHPKSKLPVRNGVVWRCCDTPECVNPDHLRGGPKIMWGQHCKGSGILKTPAKRASAVKAGRNRCVLSPELRQWLLDSSQTNVDAAHGLGISHSSASQIRIAAKRTTSTAPATVFDFARFVMKEAA